MSLLELFCAVDGFCIQYDRWLAQQTSGTSKSKPEPKPNPVLPHWRNEFDTDLTGFGNL